MLDLGDPFFNINDAYNPSFGEGLGEMSALMALAYSCGCEPGPIDVVDRAILLLSRKAKISCRDERGNTVLHAILKCHRRHHDNGPNIWSEREPEWKVSFTAPRDLLATFISASADVYATNNDDKTPSMMARKYGRMGEWIEALELCGYDPQEVVAATVHKPTRVHQTSKLSFHDYCEQRLERQYPTLSDEGRPGRDYFMMRSEETESEASQSESDYDEQVAEGNGYETNGDEEVRVTIGDPEFSLSGEKPVIPSRQGSTHHDMDINLDNQSNYNMGGVEQMVEPQVRRHDDLLDNDRVGSDNFDINDYLNAEILDDQATYADGLVDNEPEGMNVDLDISDLLDEGTLNDTVRDELERIDFNFDFDKWLNDGGRFM